MEHYYYQHQHQLLIKTSQQQPLNYPVIAASVVSSCVLLIAWYGVWHYSILTTARQRAYVLSLLSSFVTAMSSIPLVVKMVYSRDFEVLLKAESAWTLAITTFFLVFLILDLSVGAVFYRSQIGLLTGWTHHLIYIVTLFWVIQKHYTAIFVTMCILEVPTFFLAIGSIEPRWRHDYLFASTFVATRIIFHALMICSAFRFSVIWKTLSLFFPLHCYWFYGKRK
ncbi:hypothetical protein DFQ28_006494 [Apophysomyces sp. BC1034]|nr:hypothetical protein DFQ28_006494 [Apophysomyces sp. BC1034]